MMEMLLSSFQAFMGNEPIIAVRLDFKIFSLIMESCERSLTDTFLKKSYCRDLFKCVEATVQLITCNRETAPDACSGFNHSGDHQDISSDERIGIAEIILAILLVNSGHTLHFRSLFCDELFD